MAENNRRKEEPIPLPRRRYRTHERKPVYFGAVLKEARKNTGLLQKDVADALGINRTTYIAWENDKFKPDADLIPELCSILGISVSTLFGEGDEPVSFRLQLLNRSFEALEEDDQKLALRIVQALQEEREDRRSRDAKANYTILPLQPGAVAAGVGYEVPDVPPVPRFVRISSNSDRADALVRVDGDSMEPVYHDGDLVFFRCAESAYPKQDVVCSTADGMIVKRMAPDGTLYSVNPERPFEHYEDKNVRIVGIVTGVAEEVDFPDKEEEPFLYRVFEEELRKFEEKYD